MTATTKITYTSTSGDLEQFHHHFDTALGRIRAASGALHPFYVDGQAVRTREEPSQPASFFAPRNRCARTSHASTLRP